MERAGVFKEPGGIPTRWDLVDGHYVQRKLMMVEVEDDDDGVPARSGGAPGRFNDLMCPHLTA